MQSDHGHFDLLLTCKLHVLMYVLLDTNLVKQLTLAVMWKTSSYGLVLSQEKMMMMMMMTLEARNFVVVIGENLDDETRRRKPKFLKRFFNIRQRKKSWCVWGVRNLLLLCMSFQCKACKRWHCFFCFTKIQTLFFATNHLPAQQNKKIVTEKAQGSVLCKDCRSHVKCHAIILEQKKKSNTATKDDVQCQAQYLLVITVPEKLMFILGRSALSPSCKFLMSSGYNKKMMRQQ